MFMLSEIHLFSIFYISIGALLILWLIQAVIRRIKQKKLESEQFQNYNQHISIYV
jgi:hypothetical protein